MFNLFKKREDREPAASLDEVELNIAQIPGAFEIVEGYPRVDWSVVRKAVERYDARPTVNQIWTELTAQWLGMVGRQLGERYEITESRYLLLLSAQSAGASDRLPKIADEAYERAQQMVGRNGEPRRYGKHAVIALESTREYDDHITHCYAENERQMYRKNASYIARGYRNTVLDGSSANMLRALVGFLAHDVVFDFPLPHWLEAGFLDFAEDMVQIPGYGDWRINERQVRVHQRYWSWFGIEHFWHGRGFLNDSSQRLCNELAKILFRNLASDRKRRPRLGGFIQVADRTDAGAAACVSCFGCSLSELVAEFLGPGEWGPKGKYPPKVGTAEDARDRSE